MASNYFNRWGLFGFLGQSNRRGRRADNRIDIPAGQHGRLFNYAPIAPYEDFNDAIVKGYLQSDAVYSIVTKVSKNVARAPFGVYKVVDEQKYNSLKQAAIDGATLRELNDIKVKSLEPVTHKLNEIYENPNEEQTGAEMVQALSTFYMLTGNSYEYFHKGGSGRVLESHVMPSQHMEIIPDKLFPVGVSGYQYTNGLYKKFDRNDIAHARMTNVVYDVQGVQLYGMSPLQPAWPLINADIESKNAAAEILKNRGARGALSFKNDRLNQYGGGALQAEAVKQAFTDGVYGDAKDSIFVFEGESWFNRIGLSPDELKVTDISSVTLRYLCNIYGISDILFNNTAAIKYDNYAQAESEMISSVVVPILNAIRDARMKHAVRNRLISGNDIVDYDITVYNELEADRKDLMSWLKDSPLTPNEQRVYLGESMLDDDALNRVYLPANKTPIDDQTMNTENEQ